MLSIIAQCAKSKHEESYISACSQDRVGATGVSSLIYTLKLFTCEQFCREEMRTLESKLMMTGLHLEISKYL